MARNVFTQLSAFPARRHRWLVRLVLVMTLVGVHATATAGPVLIPMTDDGGSGSLAQGSPNREATIRLFEEVLSQKVPGVSNVLMTANAINHTPAGDVIGPGGFEQYVAEEWGAFPEARFRIDELISSGDQVMVRWTMTGRHLEVFEGFPATGIGVRLDGLAIYRFEDGRIVASWLQYDRMVLVEQIEGVDAAPAICPPCVMP